MLTARLVPLFALLFPTLAVGCALDSEAEDTDATEDELGSLATSEVVGTLRSSSSAGEAQAPTGSGPSYRAFKFEGYAGNKLAAYVATNNDTDPVAYILDASFRMLKRNDDLNASTKDAAIEFTPPRTGTYYLAFRNKERRPATVMARIVEDEVGGLRTKSFADGWPVRQMRAGESAYAYEQSKHAVLVSPHAEKNAISITNSSGCPAEPFVSGAGSAVPSSASFTVDPVARTIRMDEGVVGGGTEIAADGTFTLDSRTDRWGFVRARGRVAAGGFVIVSEAAVMQCHSNYRGERVHDARRVAAAIGAADPNYR